KNLLVLQFTDYNRYSRSPEHREAVRALRNDELQSWNGKEVAMMKKDLTEALDFAGQRPGMLLRQMNWFLKLGVKPEDMLAQLRRSAGKLSLQTLMEIINAFGRKNERQADHRDDLIRITRQLINDRLQLLKTPLADKKVYIERGVYDFAHSEVQFNSRSDESTYIVSGLAFRIPEEARYIRNFVYWEKDVDGERVDVDAHFYMLNRDGSRSHVGWNDEHRANGVYMSGDVTHSSPYGCEFIDLDLENENVGGAIVHIHSYTGQPFKNITNFRVAITAVSKLGVRDNKKLYTGSNSFIIHELRSNDTAINYGYINTPQRYLKFVGKTGGSIYNEEDIDFDSSVPYSLNDYLADLLKWQNCTEVSDPSDADVILRLDKPASDKDISLIDVNYFADSEVSAE
ncbi:MAG: hypothetical protein IJI05_06290, partial [Erysipelotrichaceae bacterium]|nr:hypothetical protein [Erysipelotrichaceae bacterium]